MRAVVQYFLEKSIFLNLLTTLILGVGAYKGFTMNREAFPNINFDIVTITTLFPGASPSEVEKLVTKPIEESVKSVDGIKEFRSGSIENRSGIVITIDPNTKDTQKVVDDIKSAWTGQKICLRILKSRWSLNLHQEGIRSLRFMWEPSL